MYDDLLNSNCIIYRLSDFDDYDFSSSEEGEVDESWEIIEPYARCRVDRAYTGSNRKADGIVEEGQKSLYVRVDTDLVDADRVYVDGKFYVVKDVDTISGMLDAHHKEARISIIDWVNPS